MPLASVPRATRGRPAGARSVDPDVSRHSLADHPKLACRSPRAKDGGEGRTRTFEAARATDLQSAAFDRFATSPAVCVLERVISGPYLRMPMELAKGIEPPTC